MAGVALSGTIVRFEGDLSTQLAIEPQLVPPQLLSRRVPVQTPQGIPPRAQAIL